MLNITKPFRIFSGNIRHGVRNLFYWLPIIWKDRDWDYAFLYRIMRHKLASMEKEIRDFPTLDAERRARRIHEAVLLLNRLIANQYEENAFINHRQKWGDIVMTTSPAENGCVSISFTYPHTQTHEQDEQAREESMRLYKHAASVERQDIYRLCDLLTRYIREPIYWRNQGTSFPTPEQVEEVFREMQNMRQNAEYMKTQDINRLFDILRRHVQGWWD